MAKLLEGDWQGSLFTGAWTKTKEVDRVYEPATGETLAEVGKALPADIEDAAARATRVQKAWAATSPIKRSEVFIKAAELMDVHHDEFTEWLVREIGSTRGKAGFEIEFAKDELVNASALPFEAQGVILPDVENRNSFGRREPYGVCGVITPFNVPLILAARAVAPALAIGNAVLHKPNGLAAVCGGFLFARVLQEAGLPDGLLQVISGEGVGEALVAHPAVKMIHFTGSTKVGRSIGENGGRNLTQVSLSLGGKNAFLVLDDADLEAAAASGAYGAFFYAGQSCMSPGRHIVHKSLFDAYVKRMAELANGLTLGDPWKATVDIGPMIRVREAERVASWIDEAVQSGAKTHAGGTRDGAYFRPTVITGAPTTSKLYNDEIFGPVASVIPAEDDADAIRIANDTPYGLAASVFTKDPARGRRVVGQIHAGNVHVNDATVMDYAFVPWGGFGDSGNGGRYGRHANWEEYAQWKWTTIRDQAVINPFAEGN